MAKARFNKTNENVQEQSVKTNRIVKNMKREVNTLKDEMKDIKKLLGQLMRSSSQMPENNSRPNPLNSILSGIRNI